MNKFFRNTVTFALLGAVLLGITVLVSDHVDSVEGEVHNYLLEAYGYEFVENYNLAFEMATELYDQLPVDRMGGVVYPDHFGGMYINDEGKLVILELVEDGAFDGFEDAVFKPAEFSYNELIATMDFLDWAIAGVEPNASAWYLDVINNRVVVELINYGSAEIAAFQDTVLDSPMIAFEQGEETALVSGQFAEGQSQGIQSLICRNVPQPRPPAVNLPTIPNTRVNIRTGDRIWVFRNGLGWIDGGFLSIGYRAQAANGEIGFVTAAHVDMPRGMQVGDIIANNSGVRIGEVRQARLHGIDAAFVAIGANVAMSSHTNLAAAGNYNLINLPGQRVIIHGGTSGTHVGTIIFPHLTYFIGRTTIYSAMRTTNTVNSGDSGSVVYTIGSNGNVTGTVGIVNSGAGIPCLNIPMPYTVVSRAGAINRAFNLRIVHGGQATPSTPPPPIPGIPGVPGIPPIPPRP